MRIIKPEWLRHDADKKKLTAIFSLDFHPDGTRLATAGMDNKIRLWSTPAITAKNTNPDATEPRLLSTLTAHSGAVMCVRFSHGNGRYLASGADDMVVLIWEKDAQVSTGNLTNLSGGPAPTETWHPVRRLTGHESDVCDIAWSPDNRYLATCGLDNAIFIWDAQSFERIKKITGHSQFVKGLTFDPAGKYLASQSDDKTLRIWRTSDWGLHKTVGKPFEENIFSTYFRRPSWSPDGDCIATANAANGKVPVAAVISRDTWAADLSFVGHRAAIEAVRFNPRVFHVPASQQEEEPKQIATICAAGGQDRGVTVWLTSQHMPIAAATNLFSGNLMDLAWHTVQSTTQVDPQATVALLAACSYDGTVALMEFTQQELGTPVAEEEQEQLLKRYGWVKRTSLGKRARDIDDEENENDMDAAGRPKPLAESVEQIKLEQQGAVLSRVPQESRISRIMDDMAVGENEATRELLLGSSAKQQETQPTEPENESSNVVATMPTPVRTKDGKKRVAPLFVRPIGGISAASASQPDKPKQDQPSQVQPKAILHHKPDTTAIEHERIDAPLWIEARVLGTRQMRSTKPTSTSNGKSSSEDITAEKPSTSSSYVLGPQSLIHAQSISAARVHLSVPKIVAQLSSGGPGTKPRAIAYNSAQGTRLVCNNGSTWTKYFSNTTTMVACSDKHLAVTLTDGSLHLFDSISGARLFPAIMNEAHPAFLRCQDTFCLLLDSVGQLTIWDLARMVATVDHVSVAPLLYAAELTAPETPAVNSDDDCVHAPKRHRATVALTSVQLLESGNPLVMLSDGRSYTFHTQMRSWTRLYSPQDHQNSDHFFRHNPLPAQTTGPKNSITMKSIGNTPMGLVQEKGWYQAQLTAQVNGNKKKLPEVAAVDATVRRNATLDHMEHLVCASIGLGSRDDVVRYLDILAKLLARNGDADRVAFWLDHLLGPPLLPGLCPDDQACDGWTPSVASVPKRQLLERILPVLATNRSLQTLVTEYSTTLKKLLETQQAT
ncbi:HIR complex subunit [Coemansia sp. IMI 203386]|nr:HIR complex subunit [Coemansia sp. IMI 203386]